MSAKEKAIRMYLAAMRNAYEFDKQKAGFKSNSDIIRHAELHAREYALRELLLEVFQMNRLEVRRLIDQEKREIAECDEIWPHTDMPRMQI